MHADSVGCHAIIVPTVIVKKLRNIGGDLRLLETDQPEFLTGGCTRLTASQARAIIEKPYDKPLLIFPETP
jgi:hypothetical protein